MDEEAGPHLEWAGRGLAAVSGHHHPPRRKKVSGSPEAYGVKVETWEMGRLGQGGGREGR